MTETAKLLIESRRAHKAGRAAHDKRQRALERAEFQQALDSRLEARRLDPTREDPEWENDLRNVHKGVLWQGRATAERIAQMDADLEAYYREHLGESRNLVSQVDLKHPEAAVVLPDEWRTIVEGDQPCGNCGHSGSVHDPSTGLCDAKVFSADEPGGIAPCNCDGYAPACRHAWETIDATHRRCVGCKMQQALFPKIGMKDSLAFKQLQKEAKSSMRPI